MAVSFNFTTTLSTLPSNFPFEIEVSLLNKLLNCEMDNEFVIVLEDTDETSEDVDDDVMEDFVLADLDSRF